MPTTTLSTSKYFIEKLKQTNRKNYNTKEKLKVGPVHQTFVIWNLVGLARLRSYPMQQQCLLSISIISFCRLDIKYAWKEKRSTVAADNRHQVEHDGYVWNFDCEEADNCKGNKRC